MGKPPFYHTDTGSTKSSALYQSVPTLSSPAFQAPHSTTQPVDESLLPSRKKPLTLRVIAITVLLTLCTVVPIIPWAWYVFIHKHTTIDWPNLLVISTAGPTQFLLLPTVSRDVSKILVAPLMALYAYAISADWIRSSAMGDRGRQPSPMHLASLLSLFQGASFFSLATVSLAGTKRRQLAWPPILKRVVALLIWLLFLIYSLTAINLWLNIDAKAITNASESLDLSSPEYSPELTRFSRQVNHTHCRELDIKAQGHTYCKDFGTSNDQVPYTSIAAKVLANASTDTRTAWLDNNIAILVTATAPKFAYSARALGIRAVCKSVTDQCARYNVTRPRPGEIMTCKIRPIGGKLISEVKVPSPILTCPESLGINVTISPDNRGGYIHNSVGPIYLVRDGGNYFEFDHNPFRWGDVVTSATYFNQSLDAGASGIGVNGRGECYFVGDTGFLVTGQATVNVVSCSTSVYDVEYEFIPAESYVAKSWSLTNATTAGYVVSMLVLWNSLSVSAGQGFESIDGSGLIEGATYSDVYGRQLSKLVIAQMDGILPPSPALQLYGAQTSGTQVTLVGMLLLTLVLVFLIITTIAIGVHAAIVITRTDSKFLAAARGRLISVYPLVGDSFGGLKADSESHKTAVSAALGESSFLRETEADRLQLVQEPVEGGAADGLTVRLRPRRA